MQTEILLHSHLTFLYSWTFYGELLDLQWLRLKKICSGQIKPNRHMDGLIKIRKLRNGDPVSLSLHPFSSQRSHLRIINWKLDMAKEALNYPKIERTTEYAIRFRISSQISIVHTCCLIDMNDMKSIEIKHA